MEYACDVDATNSSFMITLINNFNFINDSTILLISGDYCCILISHKVYVCLFYEGQAEIAFLWFYFFLCKKPFNNISATSEKGPEDLLNCVSLYFH